MSEQEKITGQMLEKIYRAEDDSCLAALCRIAVYVNERLAKATPPPMSEERRREAIKGAATLLRSPEHIMTDTSEKMAEKILIASGLIPTRPRPEPTIGERLVAHNRKLWVGGNHSASEFDKHLASVIDKAAGKIFSLAKDLAEYGTDWPAKTEAIAALANLETILGEK